MISLDLGHPIHGGTFLGSPDTHFRAGREKEQQSLIGAMSDRSRTCTLDFGGTFDIPEHRCACCLCGCVGRDLGVVAHFERARTPWRCGLQSLQRKFLFGIPVCLPSYHRLADALFQVRRKLLAIH